MKKFKINLNKFNKNGLNDIQVNLTDNCEYTDDDPQEKMNEYSILIKFQSFLTGEKAEILAQQGTDYKIDIPASAALGENNQKNGLITLAKFFGLENNDDEHIAYDCLDKHPKKPLEFLKSIAEFAIYFYETNGIMNFGV